MAFFTDIIKEATDKAVTTIDFYAKKKRELEEEQKRGGAVAMGGFVGGVMGKKKEDLSFREKAFTQQHQQPRFKDTFFKEETNQALIDQSRKEHHIEKHYGKPDDFKNVNLYNLPEYLKASSGIVRKGAEMVEVGAKGYLSYKTFGASNIGLSYMDNRTAKDKYPELYHSLPSIKIPEFVPLIGGSELTTTDIVENIGLSRGGGKLGVVFIGKRTGWKKALAWISAQVAWDLPEGFLEKPRENFYLSPEEKLDIELSENKSKGVDIKQYLSSKGLDNKEIELVLSDESLSYPELAERVGLRRTTWSDELGARWENAKFNVLVGLMGSAIVEGGTKGIKISAPKITELKNGATYARGVLDKIDGLDVDAKQATFMRLIEESKLTTFEKIGAYSQTKSGFIKLPEEDFDKLITKITPEVKRMKTISRAKKGEVAQIFKTKKYDLSPAQASVLDELRKGMGLGRRKVQSFAEVEELAQVIGMDTKKLLMEIDSNRITAPEVKALTNVISQNAEDITKLEKSLYGVVGQTDRLKIEKEIDSLFYETKLALKKQIKGGTEAGRSIAAYRMLANKTLDKDVWYRQAIKTAGDKKFDMIAKRRIDELLDSDLTTSQKKIELSRFIAGLEVSSLSTQISSLWKAGLLTAPSTHYTNILSTAVMGGMEKFSKTIAVPLDIVASVFTKKRTKAFSRGTMKEGALIGYAEAKQMILHGATTSDLKKWDIRKEVNFGTGKGAEILNKYTRFVFRSLGAEDKIFYNIALKSSISEQAKVISINAGMKGQAVDINAGKRGKKVKEVILKGRELENYFYKNPTKDMSAGAITHAEYVTFQADNTLAKAVSAFKRVDGMALPTDFVMPFIKTPTNVVTNVIDFSPFGTVKNTITGIVNQIKTGKFNQKGFVESVSRQLTGTGIMALGYYLAQKGMMTGAYPEDERTRQLWKVKGVEDQALKIGERWYTLKRLSPLGNLLALGADWHNADSTGLIDRTKETAFKGIKVFTEQPFFEGISNLTDAYKAPERNLGRYTDRLAGSFVPSIVRRLANAFDSEKKETEGAFDEIISRIPFLKSTLPTKYDEYGQVEKYEDSKIGLVSPFTGKTERETPELNEIERLQDLGYRVAPTKITKRITVNIKKAKYLSDSQKEEIEKKKKTNPSIKSVSVTLSAEALNIYRKALGEKLQKYQNKVVESPQYEELSDEEKAKLLEDIRKTVATAMKEAYFDYEEE